MPNYVQCNRCKDCSLDRHEYLCPQCNNAGTVIDPKEQLCNLCGECLCPIGSFNEQYPMGLVDAKVTGCIDSVYITDMNTYKFSFCEKCLRNLFLACKIKPRVSYKGNEESFEEDQKYIEYNVWKAEGGHHQAYLNGKCNETKDCPNDAKYTQKDYEGGLTEHSYCEECCGSHIGGVVKFVPDRLRILS